MPIPIEELARNAANRREYDRLEQNANIDKQAEIGEFSYTPDPSLEPWENLKRLREAKEQYRHAVRHDPKKLARFEDSQRQLTASTGHSVFSLPVDQDIPDGHSRYGALKEEGLTFAGTDMSLYEKMMYDRQSTSVALGNMTTGFLLQAAAGFMSSIATRDPREIAATGLGTDDEMSLKGNLLSQFSDYLMEKAQEQALFVDYNDPNRFWQWGRAGATVQGLGLTGGIGLEMALETVAVAAITKGLGSAVHAGSLAARGAATVARLARAGKFLRNAGKIAKYTSMAAWQGAGEAVMNAREVSKKVYDELIANGYEEGRALKIAAQAGKENFQTEVLPTMGLQLVQNALILGKLRMAKPSIRSAFVAENSLTAQAARGTYGVSSTLENLGDAMFGRIRNKTLRGAAKYTFGGVTEGAEEMFQTGVNQYVEDKVLTEHGLMWERSVSDKFFNQEMMDSALGGVFGGLVFGATGHVSTAVANRHARRRQRELEERMRDFSQHRLDLLQRLEQAKKAGDQAAIIQLENAIDMHTMEYVLMADAMRHNDVQFNTHLSFLHTALEAVDNNDQDTLDKMGLQGMDKQFIKDNFEHLVDSAIEIRDRFDHFYNVTDGHLDLAMHLTRHETRRGAQQQISDTYQGYLDQVLDQGRQAYRARLTGEDQQAYDLYERRALLHAELRNVQQQEQELSQHHTGYELAEHQRMIQERITQLQDGISQVDTEIQGLSSQARAYSKAHLTQWMQLWNADLLGDLTGGIDMTRRNMEFMDSEITRWSDPQNQHAFDAFRIREHMASLNVDHDLNITRKYLRKWRKRMRLSGAMTAQDELVFDELERRVKARDEAIASGTFNPQGPNAQQQQQPGNQQQPQGNANNANNGPQPPAGGGAPPTPQNPPNQGPQNGPNPPGNGPGGGGAPPQNQNPPNGPQNAQGAGNQNQAAGNPAQGAGNAPQQANQQPQGNAAPAQPNVAATPPASPAQAPAAGPTVDQAMRNAANALAALHALAGAGATWQRINKMRQNDSGVETAFQLALTALEQLASLVKAQPGSGSLYDRVILEFVQGVGEQQARGLEGVFNYVWNRSSLPRGQARGAIDRALNLLHGPAAQPAAPAPVAATGNQTPAQPQAAAPATPVAPATPPATAAPGQPGMQPSGTAAAQPSATTASSVSAFPSTEPTASSGQQSSSPAAGGDGGGDSERSAAQAEHESKHIIEPTARVHLDTAAHIPDGQGGVTDAPDATENGRGKVNKHPLSEDIHQEVALHPGKLGKGTRLEVVVPDGFEKMRVPFHGADGRVEMVTFEDYARRMGIDEGSDAYWDAVPMVLVLHEDGAEPVAVGAIRPVAWYNADNMGSSKDPIKQQRLINEARANIRAIRHGKRNAGTSQYWVRVTGKRGGSMLRSTNGQRRPVAEVCPSARLGIKKDNDIHDASGKKVKSTGEEPMVINSKYTLSPGMVVEIREGVTAGTPVVLRVEPATLDQEQLDSVMVALYAYLVNSQGRIVGSTYHSIHPVNATKAFGEVDTQYGAAAQSLLETLERDGSPYKLKSIQPLKDFLRCFVHVQSLSLTGKVDQTVVESHVRNSSDFREGPFVIFNGGDIYIGTKSGSNVRCVKLNQFTVDDAGSNPANLKSLMDEVRSILGTMRTNTSEEGFRHTLYTVERQADGRFRVANHDSYEQFQLRHYLTDITATNVGTENDPVYATMHNPAIYIEPEMDAIMQAFKDRKPISKEDYQRAVDHVTRKRMEGKPLTFNEDHFEYFNDIDVRNRIEELSGNGTVPASPAAAQGHTSPAAPVSSYEANAPLAEAIASEDTSAQRSVAAIAAPAPSSRPASSQVSARQEGVSQAAQETVTHEWISDRLFDLGYGPKDVDLFINRYGEIIMGMPQEDFLRTRVGRLLAGDSHFYSDGDLLVLAVAGKKARKGTNAANAVRRATSEVEAAASAFHAFGQALEAEIARFQQENADRDNPNWDELAAAIEHLVNAHGLHQAVNTLRTSNTQVASCLPALLTALPGGSLASNYAAVFGLLVEQVNGSVKALDDLLGTINGKPGSDACRTLVHALLSNLNAKLGGAMPLFDRQMGQAQPSSQSQSDANSAASLPSVEVLVSAEELGDPFAEPSAPSAPADSSEATPAEVPVTAEELGDPFATPADSSASTLPEVPVAAEELGDPFAEPAGPSEADAPSQPSLPEVHAPSEQANETSTETQADASFASPGSLESATQEDEDVTVEEPAGGGEPVEQPLTQQVRELAEEMAGQPRVFDVTEDEVQVLLRAFQLLATYPNVNWERFKVKAKDAQGNDQGVSFLEWILENTDINPNDYPHIFLERVSPTSNGGTLSLSQQHELAQFVAQSILVGYDIHQLGRITPGDLQKLASAHLVQLLGPVMANAEAVWKSMRSMREGDNTSNGPLLDALEEEMLYTAFALLDDEKLLESIVVQASNQLGEAIGLHQRQMEIYSESASVEDIFEEWSSGGLDVRAFDTASIEVNHRHGIPLPLRVLLSTMPDIAESGARSTGVFGIQRSMPIDEVISVIETAIGSQPDSTATWSELMERLEAASDDFPFLRTLVRELNARSPEVRKMFTYHFAKHMLSAQEVVYEIVKGHYRAYVNDAHGAEMAVAHQARWAVQHRRSALFQHGENNTVTPNVEEFQAVKDLLESAFLVEENGISRAVKSVDEVNLDALAKAFSKLGLNLDARTIQELVRNGIVNPREHEYYGRIDVRAPFAQGSKALGGSSLLYHVMELVNEGLRGSITPMTTLMDRPQARLLLSDIARMDVGHRGQVRVRSFRDGEHIVNGFTNGMMVHDMVRMFTHERASTGEAITAFRDTYAQLPFSSRSLALAYLREQGEDATFGVDHLALNALHRKGKEAGDPYVDLTPAEMLMAQLALLHEGGDAERWDVPGTELGTRAGRILFPTLSDKGTALAFRTRVLDMHAGHFQISDEGQVNLRPSEVLDVLLDQCVMPEYDRMVHFARMRANGQPIRVEGVDSGSRLFLMFPALNTIEVTVDEGDGTQRRVQFIELVDEMGGEVSPSALADFQQQAKDYLLDMVQREALAKVAMLSSGGVLGEKTSLDGVYGAGLGYDAGKHSGDTLAMLLCLDLTVNELIGRANQQMLFVGDPALYAKGKFKLKADHYGRTLEEYQDYTQAMDSNMGKRLAQLIAPGQRPADMRGVYNQIVAEDHVDVSSTFPYLVELFYGAEAAKDATELLTQYRNDTSLDAGRGALEELSERYPAIAPYLETNGTDAQEYTTALEHVQTLYGQGRIDEETFQLLQSKIEKQMAFEADNPDKPIPEDLYLTPAELKTVFQPLKPVHSGVIVDQEHGMARTVYVKSSSYPLLPQVTAGTQLDGVRRLLEATERRTGNRTHLVYASGMKVGAPTTKLRLFSADGSFNPEITDAMVDASAVKLDRAFHRIQQDVPYEAHRDVAMLSQMHRLLFSSGMVEEEGFQLDGKTYTGRELYRLYQDSVSELVDMLREELYEELGLTPDGLIDPEHVDETLQRMRKLFMREAAGMPELVRDSLRLEEVREKQPDGSYKVVGMRFAAPIFLTHGAVSFERLMMSLVKKRMAKLRLPGYSFVAASSTGYRRVEGSDLSEAQRSRIVYTSRYDGQLHGVNFGSQRNPFLTRLDTTDTSLTDGALVEFEGKQYILCNADVHGGILVGLDGERLPHRVKYEQMKGLGHYPVALNRHGTPYVVDDAGRIISTRDGKERYEAPSRDRARMLAQVPHIEGDDLHSGKAQVLIPCKIRDEHGKLIELFLPDGKPNPQYVAVDEKTGQLSLREDMFDPELLSQVFCRIPSGSHASMASLEIVGFLPPECGDMMVVPPGLTTQTGMDFDIDKETAYGLHVHVHRKTGYVAVDRRSKTPQQRRRLLENRLVQIHQAVYSNPSPGVQRRINRPLSLAFAKSQVELLASQGQRMESPYLGTYQARKTRSGNVGREAVGVYANAITLVGQMQSFEQESRFYYIDKGNRHRALIFTIGGVTADGVLNRHRMLGKGDTRTVSEALEECLNLATDNAKEEALDKLGISMDTINAHVAMMMLGFDKAKVIDVHGNEVDASIPFLFLKQPIIQELVARRNARKGQFQQYQSQEELFDALCQDLNINLPEYSAIIKKYGSFTAYLHTLDAPEGDMAQVMYDNIQQGKMAYNTYMLVQFMALEEMSASLIPYTQVSAVRNRGLGLSAVERDALLEALDVALNGILFFHGREPNETSRGAVQVSGLQQLLRQDGKPTHLLRQIQAMNRAFTSLQGLTLPEDQQYYTRLRDEIRHRAFLHGRALTPKQEAKIMEQMAVDLQAYAASLSSIGLWADADAMRMDLMREFLPDDYAHQSLGKYIQDLMGQENPVAAMLRANPFMAHLVIESGGRDGLNALAPTTIGLELQLGQRLDEQLFTHALRELYHNDYKLPDRNGKPYSTKQLVRELLAYSLLEGGRFGARKFGGLFPSEVLAETAYHAALRGASDNFVDFAGMSRGHSSRFATQFFQHHPEYAMPVNLHPISISAGDGSPLAWRKEEDKGGEIQALVANTDQDLTLLLQAGKDETREGLAPYEVPFISIPGKNGTFALFRLVSYSDGESRYERIDVLGSKSMTEYNANALEPPRTRLGPTSVIKPLVSGVDTSSEATADLPVSQAVNEVAQAQESLDQGRSVDQTGDVQDPGDTGNHLDVDALDALNC